MNRRPIFETFCGVVTSRRFLIGLLCALFLSGVALRLVSWRQTTRLRYQGDIVNGFYWGGETLAEAERLAPNQAVANSWPGFFRGYLGLYDRVKSEAYEGDYQLDYPPLRLLVMSVWTRQVLQEFPGAEKGMPKFVRPLLELNWVCELLAAVGIFLLVRLWVRRAEGPVSWRFLRQFSRAELGTICGLAAAVLAWLEPSMVLDAHVWPQWDAWVLPFYVFAALAASTRRWWWCGALLALGAMLKGQLLFVAPFFVFWPLLERKWANALRVLAGFFAMIALVAAPWLLQTVAAWITVALVGAISYLILRWRKIISPACWTGGLLALAAFVSAAFFGGSFAWWEVGFLYGTKHYPYLFISSCYNLPSLLADHGWSLQDSVWSHDFGSFHVALTLQWTLRLLYLVALALCAWATARHIRRRDVRVLMAMVAPWLAMFALLGQMHERYLMWGAVLSAVAVAVNLRLTIFHFLISGASTAMIAHVLLLDKKLDPTLRVIDFLEHVRPYASWLVLACIALCLWDIFWIRPARVAQPVPKVESEPLPV